VRRRKMELPTCPRCKAFLLLPLSDFGGDAGGSVMYKAWVCADSRCGWTVRIDKGTVMYTTTRKVNGA
jgi:hypothetical protein